MNSRVIVMYGLSIENITHILLCLGFRYYCFREKKKYHVMAFWQQIKVYAAGKGFVKHKIPVYVNKAGKAKFVALRWW